MKNKGYKKVKIGGVSYDEHRLIMQKHIGRRLLRNEVVHHKNGNTRDNRLSNLEIQSLSEHSRNHMRGTNAPSAKMTPFTVKAVRSLLRCGLTCLEIGKKFGVSRKAICDIKNRRTWDYV
jgi:hypothetical protein